MKKSFFCFVFCFVLVLGASAQELIVVGGAGIAKRDSTANSSYGFVQARLMIALTPGFRIGPYGGVTQYGNTELLKTPNPALLGKEFAYGLSFDSYGRLAYSYSYYFWLNTGMKSVNDKFMDGTFSSTTKTSAFFASAGFITTDEWMGWFGNNMLMVEYQKPLKSEITATWKGEAIKNLKAYNKESLKIVLVSGIKRFGGKVSFEPQLHLGYGKEFGRSKYTDFYEIGGGFAAGLNKDYYHRIFELSFYQRQYVDAEKVFCAEVVFSPSALIQAIKK